MGELQELKLRLREEASPFFTDEELMYYYNLYNQDLNKTTYNLLIMKSEDDSISLPDGMQLANDSDYWLRLAKQYKTNGSRVL